MFELEVMIPILTTIVGFAVVWGKLNERINSIGRELRSLEGKMTGKNGTPIYVTNREHMQMYKILKDDIAEIKSVISQFGEELRQQAETNAREFRKISKFMGRVEQFLLEHSKNESGR